MGAGWGYLSSYLGFLILAIGVDLIVMGVRGIFFLNC